MEPSAQKTGIIYVRVSSAEQVQGTSLDMQERLCKEFAERENIKILNLYVEEGESAKTANRTEFQKALAFCSNKKNPVNFFIVHKIDRFARNQADHFATQAILKKYGTELRSVSEPISNDPVGKAMEGMLAVFAEFDNNVRSARSRSGMVENVRKGIWQSQAPLGYKRLTKGGNLIVDDEVAPYVRQVFEEYAKGTHSFRSLAQFMAERGMRTRQGKKPVMQLMEKIVRNPVYYGLIRAFGLEVMGTFSPIIEKELFLKCQPRSKNKFRGGKRLVENSDFPLRRFATCTECNKTLTGSASTGRGGIKYPYYHHHKQDCLAAVSIPKETLEQNFVEFLNSISLSKKYEKLFKAVVADVWQSNYKLLDAENARIRKEVEALEYERQRVFDMHRTGKYSDTEFLEQKDYINLKVTEKKLLLQEKQIEEFSMETALDYCFSFVRDTAKTWLELAPHPEQRTRFQNQVFPEKIEFDGKKFGTKKMSLVYELNQPNADKNSDLVTLPGIEPGF
jgi:site-specific DNA recombinase